MKLSVILSSLFLVLVSGRIYWHRSRNADPMFSPRWNKLTVTWLRWEPLPLTVNDAVKKGWRLQDDYQEIPYFSGNRYVRRGDKTVMLLFDEDNRVLGLQTGIPKSNVEFKPLPWIKENDSFILTAYFRQPRTSKEYLSPSPSKNIGDQLLILNSSTSTEKLIQIPTKESELVGSAWTEGQCFYTMGKLYWYDLSNVSDCNSLLPVFLIYTNKVLNGFGWILPYKIDNARFVHVSQLSFSYLFRNDTIPNCFWNTSHLSLMHVFLDSNPVMNLC